MFVRTSPTYSRSLMGSLGMGFNSTARRDPLEEKPLPQAQRLHFGKDGVISLIELNKTLPQIVAPNQNAMTVVESQAVRMGYWYELLRSAFTWTHAFRPTHHLQERFLKPYETVLRDIDQRVRIFFEKYPHISGREIDVFLHASIAGDVPSTLTNERIKSLRQEIGARLRESGFCGDIHQLPQYLGEYCDLVMMPLSVINLEKIPNPLQKTAFIEHYEKILSVKERVIAQMQKIVDEHNGKPLSNTLARSLYRDLDGSIAASRNYLTYYGEVPREDLRCYIPAAIFCSGLRFIAMWIVRTVTESESTAMALLRNATKDERVDSTLAMLDKYLKKHDQDLVAAVQEMLDKAIKPNSKISKGLLGNEI